MAIASQYIFCCACTVILYRLHETCLKLIIHLEPASTIFPLASTIWSQLPNDLCNCDSLNYLKCKYNSAIICYWMHCLKLVCLCVSLLYAKPVIYNKNPYLAMYSTSQSAKARPKGAGPPDYSIMSMTMTWAVSSHESSCLTNCQLLHVSVHCQLISGADLGFLEWWGCKYKCARSAREKFKPRPLI